MNKQIDIISLGAGVQSSTMALMAAHGEITPMPRAAIFADTQSEPQSVYKWLDWLEGQLPFPVYRVTLGSLAEVSTFVRISRNGNKYTNGQPPAFMDVGNVKPGILQRQCSQDFKILAIQREVRRIRKAELVGSFVQWIGISRDEAHRMKPSRLSYIDHKWPLIELGMTRNSCLDWMLAKGYPEPPRSSCIFCPYHSNDEWKRLKLEEPADFQRAVKYEKDFQAALSQTRVSGVPYLHRSCQPLDQIDFTAESPQRSLFGNECDGVCGN
jgi:hypothetical protein